MLEGRYVYFKYDSVQSACRYGYNWLRKYINIPESNLSVGTIYTIDTPKMIAYPNFQ